MTIISPDDVPNLGRESFYAVVAPSFEAVLATGKHFT